MGISRSYKLIKCVCDAKHTISVLSFALCEIFLPGKTYGLDQKINFAVFRA